MHVEKLQERIERLISILASPEKLITICSDMHETTGETIMKYLMSILTHCGEGYEPYTCPKCGQDIPLNYYGNPYVNVERDQEVDGDTVYERCWRCGEVIEQFVDVDMGVSTYEQQELRKGEGVRQ